ncbi:hypothetical protein ACLIXC_003114, partial [Yersinia enterocolitica]
KRLTLRASAGAVQNGLQPICHSIAAYLQLELFRVCFSLNFRLKSKCGFFVLKISQKSVT